MDTEQELNAILEILDDAWRKLAYFKHQHPTYEPALPLDTIMIKVGVAIDLLKEETK